MVIDGGGGTLEPAAGAAIGWAGAHKRSFVTAPPGDQVGRSRSPSRPLACWAERQMFRLRQSCIKGFAGRDVQFSSTPRVQNRRSTRALDETSGTRGGGSRRRGGLFAGTDCEDQRGARHTNGAPDRLELAQMNPDGTPDYHGWPDRFAFLEKTDKNAERGVAA